ncbi:hypothetical protein V5799_000113, partial [Amblyomma americanum]
MVGEKKKNIPCPRLENGIIACSEQSIYDLGQPSKSVRVRMVRRYSHIRTTPHDDADTALQSQSRTQCRSMWE